MWIIHSYYDLFAQLCPALWESMDCPWVPWDCPWDSPGKNMEWVAIPFCRGSSQPRDWTWVPHIAGRFLMSGATREASQVVLVVKNPPANTGDIWVVVWSLGQEDSLEESMATHSSILAWRISWAEEAGRIVHSVARSWTWQRLSMHSLSWLGKLWFKLWWYFWTPSEVSFSWALQTLSLTSI